MFEINFNKMMNDLVSEDFEVQCNSLASFYELSEAVVEQSIRGFEISKTPDLMIEHLVNISLVVRQKLEAFIETTEKSEKRVLASLALLYLGSQKGLTDVVNEFTNQGKYEHLAVSKLIQSRIPGTGDLIIKRLREFTLEELKNEKKSLYVNTLLNYLSELSITLPDDLKKTFESIRESDVYKYYTFPK